MLSHDKIIFCMLFESFHDTSPYSPSLTVASFFPFKRQSGVLRDFFTGNLTKSELENHRYDQPAEVIWVKAISSYYQFLSGISGWLKNVSLFFKRRKRTHLLRRYSHYSVSSTSQAAFFIGGWDGNSPLSVIAKYENDKWSLHGNLKRRRESHGSITDGTTTIVIGGGTDDGS